MSKKPLRYYVRLVDGQWHVVDREIRDMDDLQVLAVLQSEDAARTVCASLNRGVCETIDPQGRWT
jgi:hypothetical protein